MRKTAMTRDVVHKKDTSVFIAEIIIMFGFVSFIAGKRLLRMPKEEL